MDFPARELLVARLLAGCVRCRLIDISGRERLFLLKTPDRYQRYVAQEVYQTVLEEDGLLSREEMLLHLAQEELWSEAEEDKLKDFEKNLEELKIQLYELQFKEYERKRVREMLDITRKELALLHDKKYALDANTREGAASIARLRYLVGASLCRPNGQPVFEGEDAFWKETNYLLDQAFEVYAKTRLSEAQVRELARSEPWRSLWAAKKAEGSIFGLPSADLSDEQRGLISWSLVYDSIFEHPESPPQSVIEDDDMLDGWMIIQRRRREKETERSRADSAITNEKIRNSEEVFVVVNSAADAKRVHEMNDTSAKMTKAKRMAMIKKHGVVDEVAMPDSQLKIQQQQNQEFAQRVRGG